MTERDLADRLEKARKALKGSDTWEYLTDAERYDRVEALHKLCQDNLPTIIASLRRSAPASGETREAAISIPKELTPELRDILGMMNFMCSPIAWGFRDAGADIPHKTEAEQAFVLHWLLCKYQEHGADWRKAAGEEMAAVAQKLKDARAPSGETREEAGS